MALQSFRDTVSRCGIFCALVNGIECCKTEGIVDVFEVVKALRTQKPGSVPTLVGRSIFLLATVAQYYPLFHLPTEAVPLHL